MFKWLSYGTSPAVEDKNAPAPKDLFYHREFSFTLENDVYIRYLSFKSAQEFKAAVVEKRPHKIDIGAIYSHVASLHNSISSLKFKPLMRELVFDIDFTDYAEVVLPNDTKDIWANGAWGYMQCAMEVLDKTLRLDFGFEHLLFVFSGRRGIHCWVCDSKALGLEDSERQAVCDYLSLVVKDSKMKLTTPLFPSLKTGLELCMPHFLAVALPLCFLNEKEWTKVLDFLPNIGNVKQRLLEEWRQNASTPERKWTQLTATIKDVAKKESKVNENSLLRSLDAIVLHYTYPRLDVNVSTHRNHLLKSPFVVHPKTGNVCVPIFNLKEFHPHKVPNMNGMLKELDETGDCPSLGTYVKQFETLFLAPLNKDLAKERKVQETSMREAKRMEQDRVEAENGQF